MIRISGVFLSKRKLQKLLKMKKSFFSVFYKIENYGFWPFLQLGKRFKLIRLENCWQNYYLIYTAENFTITRSIQIWNFTRLCRIRPSIFWVAFLRFFDARYLYKKSFIDSNDASTYPNWIWDKKLLPFLLQIYPGINRDLGAVASEFVQVIFYAIDHLVIYEGKYVATYQYFLNFRWTLIPVGLICTYFYMPETKNLSLVEAEKLASEITLP